MNHRHFIFIFVLTLSLGVTGQQLPTGTFAHSTGFTYQQFTFKNKYKFNYLFSSCTGGQEGSGTYAFNNNKLVLTFDNPTKMALPLVPKFLRQQTQKDSSLLSFKFFDQKDTTAVSGVIIRYQSKTNSKFYGTLSNDSGFGTLRMLNTEFPVELEIRYVGIDPQTIKLDSSGNYSITFPLNFDFIKPFLKGDKLQFVVDDYNDEELVLKEANENNFKKYTKKD